MMSFLANLFFGGGADKADIPALVRNGALVIDVRTSAEFAEGHIQSAVNIPYDVIAREIGRIEADTNRAIVVYCRSGARSDAAKKSLELAGYSRVVNGGRFSRMRQLLGE